MMDHLIDNDFFKIACSYCLKSTKEIEWKSEFEIEIHYKSGKCDCGKELKIRMPFYGSGHDTLNEHKKKKSIEDKI